ncbi:hypothetical protein NDU88_008885 [Pleurodeles waltl]|uniref:Histone H2A/H2B/H3 domain-containing protein n=1 Tax=Pleurodeles waltl TaxID=8319 RepID=A0AAV7RX20_PLEWA|nr:hypothetical protein NDU88_008885 [Pleurodeles waltl]
MKGKNDEENEEITGEKGKRERPDEKLKKRRDIEEVTKSKLVQGFPYHVLLMAQLLREAIRFIEQKCVAFTQASSPPDERLTGDLVVGQ